MRKLIIFGVFLIGLPILAQPVVIPNQNLYVPATADVGGSTDASVAVVGPVTDFFIVNQTNNAPGWETEPFFEIADDGSLIPLQALFPLFNLTTRAIVTFSLTVVPLDQTLGAGAQETVTVIVVQDLPYIIPGQVRSIGVNAIPATSLGQDIRTVNTATAFDIVSGNEAGLFRIDNVGTITTTRFLDGEGFVDNPTVINLGVRASNSAGSAPVETVVVEIAVFGTDRCPLITADQVRFIPVTAVAGDLVGFPIDTRGLRAITIDSAFIDTPPNFPPEVDEAIVTGFTIEDPIPSDTSFGQIKVVQRLIDFIPDETAQQTYHKIILTVRGFALDPVCSVQTVTQDIEIYILPRGAGTSSGDGDGNGDGNDDGNGDGDGVTETDFSVYIDQPELEACIRQNIGLRDEFPITINELQSLTHLDCFCSGITDLTGLQLFKELTFLNLQNNGIIQLQPISGLLNLQDLKLSGNLLYDLETDFPFASLVNLVRLDLSNNSITDTSAFATLQSLEFITVANNNLCDIASLASNPGIGQDDVVILDGNHLISQEALAQIGQIETRGPAFISFANQSPCSNNRFIITQWPNDLTVLDASANINRRDLCPTGPN